MEELMIGIKIYIYVCMYVCMYVKNNCIRFVTDGLQYLTSTISVNYCLAEKDYVMNGL
jgi:hypothetical protein